MLFHHLLIHASCIHAHVFETFSFPVVMDTTLRELHMLDQQSTNELCSPSLFIFLINKT